MTATLKEDLQRVIKEGDVLFIVGSGVSVEATRGNPWASWSGLVRSGLAECERVAGLDAEMAAPYLKLMEKGRPSDLLRVAELVTEELKGPGGGDYRSWLRRTVGSLRAEDRSVLEALRELPGLFATTNPDGLLEDVTGLPAVTWRQRHKIERVLRGDEKGIVHLHGYWDDAESVVLGIRDYQRLLGDEHAQALLKASLSMKTLIFVGCGEGLADPNFGALLEWARGVFSGSEYVHYRLALEREAEALRQQHRDDRIKVVPYGATPSELAPFLRSLAPAARPEGAARAVSISRYERITAGLTRLATEVEYFLDEYLGTPAQPRAFGGRAEQLEGLDSWLADPVSRHALVIENAGRGKSALLAHWIHRLADSGVATVVFVPISIRFSTAMLVDALRLLGERLRHLDRATTAQPRDPEEWQAEIRQALLKDRAAPVLLVFDGLDEAVDWELGKQLKLPPQLGRNVKVLVAGRPVGARDAEGWRRQLGFGPEALRVRLPELTEGEVADALRSLGASDLAGDPNLVRQLHHASEGDPLLVRLYLDALSSQEGRGAFLTPGALAMLQPGLQALFESWFQHEDERWRKGGAEALRPALEELLGICATALGPLLQEDLCAVAEGPLRQPANLRRVLPIAGRFVIGDGERQGLVFSHPRLRDYWFERMLSPEQRVRWEQRFIELGQQTLRALPRPAPGWRTPSEYIVRSYGAHLERAGAEPERFYELLSPAWAEAWERLDETFGGFLMDVQRAWSVAERAGGTGASHAVALLRCGLLQATVASLHALRPAVVIRLVERQVWSLERAVARARLMPEASKRVRTLWGLSRLAPEPERSRLQSEALDHASGLEGQDLEFALKAFALDLPGHHLTRAIALTERVPNLRRRAELCSRLLDACQRVPPEFAASLLEASGRWKSEGARAWMLCALYRRGLPIDLRDALDLAWREAAPSDRVEALVEVARSAPDGEDARREACERLLRIELGPNKLLALRTVASLGPQTLLNQVLDRALRLDRPQQRLMVLLALLRRNNDESSRAKIENLALDAAREIRHDPTRVSTLVAILAEVGRDPSRRLELIEEARALADWENTHLMVSSLVELAAALNPAAFPGEASARARILDQALKIAREAPSIELQCDCFSQILPQLGPGERERVRDEAFALLPRMQDGREARSLAAHLIEHLNDEQLKTLPSYLSRISDLGERVEAVARVALLIEGSARSRAVALCREWIERLSDPHSRSKALGWLSLLLPRAEAVDLLRAAFDSLCSMNATIAASPLRWIAELSAKQGAWELALSVLDQLEASSLSARGSALGDLIQIADPDRLLQLEQRAGAWRNPLRDEALAQVAVRYAQLGDLLQARRVVNSMAHSRATVLVRLACAFPEGSSEREQAERAARRSVRRLPESNERLMALGAAIPFLRAGEMLELLALHQKFKSGPSLLNESLVVERVVQLGQIDAAVELARRSSMPSGAAFALALARSTGDWPNDGPHAALALELLSDRNLSQGLEGTLLEECERLKELPPKVAAKVLSRLVRAHAPGGRIPFLIVTGAILAPLIFAAAGQTGVAQSVEAIGEICNGKD